MEISVVQIQQKIKELNQIYQWNHFSSQHCEIVQATSREKVETIQAIFQAFQKLPPEDPLQKLTEADIAKAFFLLEEQWINLKKEAESLQPVEPPVEEEDQTCCLLAGIQKIASFLFS